MDEFWSWQGYHKTYCDRVSLLLWFFPTGVCMGREREGFLWGSAFFSSSLGFCRVQNQGHTLLECWRSVSAQVPVPPSFRLVVRGATCQMLDCYSKATEELAHSPWPNLSLGPVTYDLRLNSILVWDFLHFCDTCFLVFALFWFLIFLFKHSSEFGWEKHSVLLILLLLFQLHHRGVASAVQAVNSMFLPALLYHKTRSFQKVQDRRGWMFWANIV